MAAIATNVSVSHGRHENPPRIGHDRARAEKALRKVDGDLAKLARDGKLKPDQMQGGCFTISSLGGIGGIYFTPIINAPEVAIMGVCRSFWKQVSTDGRTSSWRFMLPLSLSWDHRVIDGAAAARFNAYFAGVLQDFRRVLL